MDAWKTIVSFRGNLGLFSGAFSVSCREGIWYIIGHTNILLSERRHMGYGSDTVPNLEGKDVANWRDSHPNCMSVWEIVLSFHYFLYWYVFTGMVLMLIMTFLVSNVLNVGVDLPPLRDVGTWDIHSMSILHPMFSFPDLEDLTNQKREDVFPKER